MNNLPQYRIEERHTVTGKVIWRSECGDKAEALAAFDALAIRDRGAVTVYGPHAPWRLVMVEVARPDRTTLPAVKP